MAVEYLYLNNLHYWSFRNAFQKFFPYLVEYTNVYKTIANTKMKGKKDIKKTVLSQLNTMVLQDSIIYLSHED